MPSIKDSAGVLQSSSPKFDGEWAPGVPVPYEGIYMCCGCGLEIVEIPGDTFPDGEIKHPEKCEGIRWQLVVAVNGEG
jgi:hypothetical protein